MATHDKARIDYWFPRAQDWEVQVPETEFVEWGGSEPLEKMFYERGLPEGWEGLLDRIDSAAVRVGGYPIFLRTGLLSAKHEWKETCFVPSREDLDRHVYRLVETQEMAMMLPPVKMFAVREFLDLDTRFHAFHGEMPINVEFRLFADQEKTWCQHPYWPPEAFDELPEMFQPDRENWRDILALMHSGYVLPHWVSAASHSLVENRFEGGWSLDWAQHSDGRWFLIDMAPAKFSYHDEDCPNRERWPDPRDPENNGS